MQFQTEGDTIRVTAPDWPALARAVTERWRAGRGFALATLNLDHLVKVRADPAFRKAYAAHDIVTADGNPVVWLSRLAGRPVRLVAGSDSILPLCTLAAREGVPVALVGSTAATLEAAADHLAARVPGLRIALREAPPMGFDPDGPAAAALLDRVAASGARLCFLALGAPRQERLAIRGRTLAPAVGFASIGAGLDFFGGAQRRAPAAVRALALEWVWRLVRDPRRMGPRYGACIAALPGLVLHALVLRRRGAPAGRDDAARQDAP
ncbi:WecB/TagA/CpsF family glycosyltransferase [Roseivivax isoporae]|uniref:Glycosyl transferase n=1 Tax=Roseivivax isoporae LMG 25204 TaxID=1449351 RepID=X7F4V5_9RHOB|nr:WecB/TagA/CpsF family glycosyltransferase [Roseivivax isoporae]ETX27778.1 glycosyl transferase [Roseivivax isoporae LMG 25204]